MGVDRVVRLERHLQQIVCGPDGAGVHHRSIEIVDARLRSIDDLAPFVDVAAQIHDDRQQPVFVRRSRPFGQFDVLAEHAGPGHPDDVIGVEEQRLRQFAERQREAQRQIGIVNGFQGAMDEIEAFAEAEHFIGGEGNSI